MSALSYGNLRIAIPLRIDDRRIMEPVFRRL
jgi:hypothetical protein